MTVLKRLLNCIRYEEIITVNYKLVVAERSCIIDACLTNCTEYFESQLIPLMLSILLEFCVNAACVIINRCILITMLL